MSEELNRESIIRKIKMIYDPEIPVDIYELGLIYDIKIMSNNDVKIGMTLTAPNCPAAETLPVDVKNRIEEIPDVGNAEVEILWEPQWNPEMMSEAAKLQLGYL